MPWYDSTMQLRDFVDALIEAEAINQSDRATVMSKPYKYTNEYTIWKNAGFPSSEDDDGWDEFISGLEGEDEEEESNES